MKRVRKAAPGRSAGKRKPAGDKRSTKNPRIVVIGIRGGVCTPEFAYAKVSRGDTVVWAGLDAAYWVTFAEWCSKKNLPDAIIPIQNAPVLSIVEVPQGDYSNRILIDKEKSFEYSVFPSLAAAKRAGGGKGGPDVIGEG
jgi:hypothetical protein